MNRMFLGLFLFVLAGSVSAETDTPVLSGYDEAVASLKAVPAVVAALDHVLVMEPESHKLLIELNEIEAPPFKEDKRAARYIEMLKEAGLNNVYIDEVGNAIGLRPGRSSDRLVAVVAHLDTVFPAGTDVTVKERDGKLYAPGIGDNTRGLVTVLGMLKAMKHANLQTDADILFVGNVGEEGLGDLRGVKHLFRDGARKIDAMIAIDGGESSRIVYGGVGSHRYRVTFIGPGGHSWGAFGLANPHHALGRMIAIFDQNATAITSVGKKSSYNIGRIGGGTSINAIPFESWAEIDMRSGEQENIDAIDAILKAAIKQALEEENAGRLSGPVLTVDIQQVGKRPAAKGDINQPIVQRASAVTRSFGITPEYELSSTDSNIPISLGVPAVTMSRGGIGGGAHSLNEWWQNADGHLGIQIAMLTLLLEAGLVE
jgi:tripeptide aminopeptidase